MKEKGAIVRRRQKPSALYYLRIHIGRRGKEQAHSLTLFARKERRKKKETDGRTDTTTLLRHVHTLSLNYTAGLRAVTHVHAYTWNHTRRSAASAEDARTAARRTRRTRRGARGDPHTPAKRNPRFDVTVTGREGSRRVVSPLITPFASRECFGVASLCLARRVATARAFGIH